MEQIPKAPTIESLLEDSMKKRGEAIDALNEAMAKLHQYENDLKVCHSLLRSVITQENTGWDEANNEKKEAFYRLLEN